MDPKNEKSMETKTESDFKSEKSKQQKPVDQKICKKNKGRKYRGWYFASC